jgi:sigma-54 dependent transcriptional regulator, acetoin dehydrogenase operon transcriptional activator AcoR
MSHSTASTSWGSTARQRRAQDERVRPIAAQLGLPADHITAIDASHDRCSVLGLSRFEQPDVSPLAKSELAVLRDRNQRLYVHAAPIMETLYEQIARTQSMVVLCDVTGTIIHSIGDDDFLSRASKVALQPGVNWSEASKGTNAIGTALVSETPTLVHADEHFMHANHFLTCSAAPILDPRGNILGVLDVTGDQRGYHQHTMALVKMSARMIENHWLSDDYRHVIRLHFHSRAEFIGTLMEGILAVTPEGKIVGANRGALDQLGLSGAATRMHTVASLLGYTVSALVDRFRSPLATPLPVHLPDGRQMFAVARFNAPDWQTVSAPAASDDPNAAAGLDAAKHRPLPVHLPGSAAPETVRGAAGMGMGMDLLTRDDTQMATIADKLRRVAGRDIPILILGETGTGKELLARAIHQESSRAKQPFVAVNCASIPEALIEAELFGYEDGAFTGARRKGQVGRIVQANGGTLFLDEIGDMPISLQAHLLRVLQERQVVPLGGGKSIAVDVAIVCATHRNLRDMIAAQTFREDLYYRLNGLAVRLPPLRQRADLALLAERIVRHESGAQRLRLAPEVLAQLKHYSWPGNVRQLANVLRTACVMAMATASVQAAAEGIIRLEHLPDDFLEELRQGQQALAEAPPAASVEPLATGAANTAGQSLDAIEIDVIRRTLDACGGNISEAAKRLGISRNTVYRKLRWNTAAVN